MNFPMDPDKAALLLEEYSQDRELDPDEQITLAFHLLCGAAKTTNRVIVVTAQPDGRANIGFQYWMTSH